jgi:hypothetical protein
VTALRAAGASEVVLGIGSRPDAGDFEHDSD